MKTNREAAIQFVEFGLRKKAEGKRESASGPGSSLRSAQDVIAFLFHCVEKYEVTSILDLGCGDWNWMSQVMNQDRMRHVRYEGWDVHHELIDGLNQTYGNSQIEFKVADILCDPFPSADLIVCRDVLFHMETELAKACLLRVINSPANLFIGSTFPNRVENTSIKAYLDIENWGFYQMNLDIAPFNLDDRLIERRLERQCSKAGEERYVALYNVA